MIFENEIYFYLDLFNNRERAVIIWLVIFFSWALTRKKIRLSIFEVLKALVQKIMLITLAVMGTYVALVVLLLHKIQFWNFVMIKDTVVWFLFSAFILLIDSITIAQRENYFRKVVLDNIKLVLVLEFVVNFYAFSLWFEMIMLPILLILITIDVLSRFQEEYKPLKRVTESILVIFGFCLIALSLYKIFQNYQNIFTLNNLCDFSLPPLLTVSFLPFLYFAVLYAEYEKLFVSFNILLSDNKEVARFVKWKTFRFCFLNLSKLKAFGIVSRREFIRSTDKPDILNFIREFKNNKMN